MPKDYLTSSKLLDAWYPPLEAGEPLGFITTSFTFNASFFEEDCLGSFLRIESDPNSEALSYIIEREEKLSKIECAMVLADQRHCNTNRNIRWDLLPVRIPAGIQHSKVTVLFWTKYLRIIIGSANLTNEGYRKNQEVFTVFDAFEKAEIPLLVFSETFEFLKKLISHCIKCSPLISSRGEQLILKAAKTLDKWQLKDQNLDPNKLHAYPIFIYPGHDSAIKKIKTIWTSYYTYLPDKVQVISPFFDMNRNKHNPINEINKEILNKQGQIKYYCSGESDFQNTGYTRLNAPKYLKEANPNNSVFCWIKDTVAPENEHRPLHIKNLVLEKGNWILSMIGSSNFTAAGLGTGSMVNYESNIAFITSFSKNSEAYNALKQCKPASENIDQELISWHPDLPENSTEPLELALIPPFILSAEADLINNSVIIVFRFDINYTLTRFAIKTEDGTEILNESIYAENQLNACFEFTWCGERQSSNINRSLPSGFDITWPESTQKAWLPLNVKNYNCLPPPEQLKDLPLDLLIRILTSAKPLHQILKKHFKSLARPPEGSFDLKEIIDPHKRIDTSGFLLQRTRKISYAFSSIRKRMSMPMPTKESLRWKLYGPVGLHAFVIAIGNDGLDSKTIIPEEKLFFLAELMLELSLVIPTTQTNCLSKKEIKTEINRFIAEIKSQIKKDPYLKNSWIKRYVYKTIDRAPNNPI